MRPKLCCYRKTVWGESKNLNKTVVHGNSTLAGSYKSGTITPLSKLLFLTHIFRKGE